MYTTKNTRLLYLVGFDFLLFSAQNIVVTEHAIIPNNPPTAIKLVDFHIQKFRNEKYIAWLDSYQMTLIKYLQIHVYS